MAARTVRKAGAPASRIGRTSPARGHRTQRAQCKRDQGRADVSRHAAGVAHPRKRPELGGSRPAKANAKALSEPEVLANHHRNNLPFK